MDRFNVRGMDCRIERVTGRYVYVHVIDGSANPKIPTYDPAVGQTVIIVSRDAGL